MELIKEGKDIYIITGIREEWLVKIYDYPDMNINTENLSRILDNSPMS